MNINVLTQLREVIEAALSGQTKLRKSFRNFFIGTMILHIVMRGRINYTSVARAGDSCESRFRQNYKRTFDWLDYNTLFASSPTGRSAQGTYSTSTGHGSRSSSSTARERD